MLKGTKWVITNFVNLREYIHLHINVNGIKEIMVDLRRKTPLITPLNIQSLDIEIMGECKYMGVQV